jgi:hypothetical protein
MELIINASTTAARAGDDARAHAPIRKLTFDNVIWIGEQALIAAGLVLSVAAFLL